MSVLPQDTKPTGVRVIQLLPNLLTILAICAGLTAIRFGYQGEFQTAVQLILIAGVLDGLDGRLARSLNCPTPFGAELDSLADFANFGVAPVLILNAWAFPDYDSIGWMAVLSYAVCCVLRLARFNVNSRLVPADKEKQFFVGVPAPAGAFLVMLPMFVSFLFPEMPSLHPLVVAGYIFAVGLLMISRIPTFSFKSVYVSRKHTHLLLLGAVLTAVGLMTYPWAAMILITVVYFCSLLWGVYKARKRARRDPPPPS